MKIFTKQIELASEKLNSNILISSPGTIYNARILGQLEIRQDIIPYR